MSTKVFRVFDGDFNLFGERATSLRHIFSPKIEYEYVHSPTVSKDHLYQFDDVDALSRREMIRVALENKIQARNQEKVWDFVYFSPAVEYQIHNPERGSFFDRITADFEMYPRPGLAVNSDVEYDCVDRAFKEANVDFTLRDEENDAYSFSFGHRYSRNESSQGTLRATYQITPKMQLRNYLRYEYKTGDFKDQQYMLRRDLHCWWMDVGLDVDKQTDITFWVIFRLKAFPEVNVEFEQGYDGAKKEY
jgi:hypothetical protein